MTDYAKKTVTIDQHPHLSRPHGEFWSALLVCLYVCISRLSSLLFHYFEPQSVALYGVDPLVPFLTASIHPCQHGPAMLNIIEALKECGAAPQVEQYMFIFLKFIQSVVPTIEYDYTFDVQVRGKDA